MSNNHTPAQPPLPTDDAASAGRIKKRPAKSRIKESDVETAVKAQSPTDNEPDSTPEFDPFNPESLRLSDTTTFGVERVLTTVPVDKPNKHVFVRVHPSADYRLETALFVDRSNRDESYIVVPKLRDALATELVPVRLCLTITRHGDVSFWPVKLPGADGRSNPWHESAAAAAELAVNSWVRVSANQMAGRYDVMKATGQLPEPEWPELTMRELIKLAFENRIIDDYDHPVLKSLRGEV